MKNTTDRSAAAKKAAATRKHRAAGKKAAETRKLNITAKKRSEAVVKANETRKRNATAKVTVGAEPETNTLAPESTLFAIGEIVSMENDDPGWEEETVIGMVVRKEGSRMKVVFAYKQGETKISWLTRHDEQVPNRWIDNTYAAIVRVEEASVSQREAFARWVPLDRQKVLLERER